MTIDDLERGMKLRFDQHVHFAEDLDRLEASQKRTYAAVAALAESQKVTEATVAALARRIDAYIAAQGNGHQPSP